ncbi:E3 ubiquitin-protein ligase FANCL-like [Chelonus insularis]|uniref:E3 ubiquitin-protein ligase FANCL-like n=1 Tax=Chelonus insularis TaxID=460826 RepID=UPI00158C9D76|nr:E3 ubiquitin-protein ligase FANCL-like [Chelonus insularis]XP_034946320.1 E3 ubiquitin-protein ligase FANCL-like [Chelonus insularis]XP_034946328.1 E3 ubiquitin-protein ligase FANCL-like [Chelonus insularis]
MNEYQEIIKWHPHLVLISEKPVTWYGLLNINNEIQMKIKLKVPEYPKLQGARIFFGESVSLTYGTDFTAKVSVMLENSNSVMAFLSQLQKLLNTVMKKQTFDYKFQIDWSNHDILDELKTALTIPDITISAGDNLNLVKLEYKNTSMILKYKKISTSQWTFVSSDLPTLSSWSPLETCISTLSEAAETLKTRTDVLEDTWTNLYDIDKNCWVLDPINPKPFHLHRRIYLNPALSLLITLDPLNPDALQEIKILGSEDEVSKCQDLISNNLQMWTSHKSVVKNLLDLLELPELPKPKQEKLIESDGIVSDKECCICFSNEGEDGQSPSIVCNNGKCQKHFHTSCLRQWLQVIAESSVLFDRIHGICPNCKTKISCPLLK